jgi:hypothetical protein
MPRMRVVQLYERTNGEDQIPMPLQNKELSLLYVLSLAEEDGHDEGMWEANLCAVNEPVSSTFYKGKVLGILGVFDEALYS